MCTAFSDLYPLYVVHKAGRLFAKPAIYVTESIYLPYQARDWFESRGWVFLVFRNKKKLKTEYTKEKKNNTRA